MRLRNIACAALAVALAACAHRPYAEVTVERTLEAGMFIDLPEESSVRTRHSSLAVAFREKGDAVWLVARHDFEHLQGTEAKKNIASHLLEAYRRDVSHKRAMAVAGKTKHAVIDEELYGGGALVVFGQQYVRRGDGPASNHARATFRLFWPSAHPNSYVDGSVEWKGDLQPRVDSILATLRTLKLAAR